jgi:hypothetical protein
MKQTPQQIPESWTVLFVILILVATGYAETTFHISPTGNDVSGNGSLDAPWKTSALSCNP